MASPASPPSARFPPASKLRFPTRGARRDRDAPSGGLSPSLPSPHAAGGLVIQGAATGGTGADQATATSAMSGELPAKEPRAP